MKTKWHFSAFIIILTVLGISLQQFSVSNQEIIVQFTNDEVGLIETQNTIAIVKKQLQQVGVKNIKVHKGENGELKISYFSDIDVASIKKIFSARVPLEASAEEQEKELKLGFTSFLNEEESSNFPSDKNSNSYKLDVFEIQKGDDAELDLNGFALELNPENDRFFKPVVYYSYIEIDVRGKNKIETTAYIAHRNISITIDNSSFNIPEVRAGPLLT